jgi:hypothetical protein
MAVVLKTTEMKVSQGSNPWLSVLVKMNAFLFSLRLGLGLAVVALVVLISACGIGAVLFGLGLLILPYVGPGWTVLILYGLLVTTAFYVNKKHHRKLKRF